MCIFYAVLVIWCNLEKSLIFFYCMKFRQFLKRVLLVSPKFKLILSIYEFGKWLNSKKPKMILGTKIAIGSGVTFFIIILFGWIAFPKILKGKIKGQVALKKGAEIRDMWTKVPFPIDFKVYIFNVTNPMGVHNGDSPVLDEIGPYFYDEWKEKVNLEDDDSDDTVKFNPRNTWIFNQKESGHLTGEEIITIPHPLIIGMGITILRTKPSMLNVVNKAINGIMRKPETAFLTAKVRDILFDGIIINCTVTEFAAKAVCGQLKTEATNLIEIEENIFKFSFFGAKNGSLDPPFKVYRGIKHSKDLGRMVEFNNDPVTRVWDKDECNLFHGTDSTIFPPFLTKEDGLWSFAPDLCRSLGAIYVESMDYKGIPTWRYTANFGDASKNEEDQCYCTTLDTCPKKGVMDLFKCVKAPLYASLPHFYDADPSYVEGVRGLHPNSEDHEIFIIYEAMTGTPLAARKRLQFNMPLEQISKIEVMKSLPNTLVPLFWVEEGLVLNATYVGVLKGVFTTLKVVKIMKWTILFLSLIGVGVGGFLHMHQKKGFTVTPVKAAVDALKGTGGPEFGPKKSMIISTIGGNDNNNSISHNGANGANVGNGMALGDIRRSAMSKN